MWRFYWRLLREVPSTFREAWETSAFWTSLVVILLGASVPVLKRLEVSGWYALIPVGALLLWAGLRANYRHVQNLAGQVERKKSREARQAIVNQLANLRMDACNLLAKPVRSDADYVAWQLEANEWAENVGPILEANFELAVRRRFDFVGLHYVPVVGDAFHEGHNQGMVILDYKVKVLDSIIGDGIAQP
jgi:hypothetical protein